LQGDVFGELIGEGANKIVFRDAKNPGKVLKINNTWTYPDEDIMTKVLEEQ
jgi:hypothetical protein